MERKPIRLTTTSYAVMSLLELCGEATPYELKQTLELSIENFWPVPHTTFYEEPARLAKAGYLSQRQEQSGRRRKRYSLTDAGRAALREWADSPGSPPSQYRDEGMLKVFAGADPLVVLAGRADWHRAKQAEFEGHLRTVRAEHAQGERSAPEQAEQAQAGSAERIPSGPEATLIGGIAYHEQMAGIFERLIEQNRGAAQA